MSADGTEMPLQKQSGGKDAAINSRRNILW